MEKIYRIDIDVLKGFAIIAVLLYHLGLLKSGYLGVDAFFVINGFFVIPPVLVMFRDNKFSFFSFLKKRMVRLFPLISLSTFAVIILGYAIMLPDDYENLAQASIAGNLMSENILSAITARSYWDVSNDYKPLMHLWYIGILFEFYVLLPLVLYVIKFISNILKKDFKKVSIVSLALLSLISFTLFVLPFGSVTERFYFLHYRFFEIGIGGLAGIIAVYAKQSNISKYIGNISFWCIIILLFCSLYYNVIGKDVYTGGVIGVSLTGETGIPLNSKLALILTVLLTTLYVLYRGNLAITKSSKLALVGKMSFSIFIVHQIVIAFYRYCISNNQNIYNMFILILITILLSLIAYYFIEKKTSNESLKYYITLSIMSVLSCSYIYMHAGVVRDIPELDVYKDDVHRGMFSEYCDRIYQYKDFTNEEGKKKVIVVGVSFGRDFANVLLESQYKDSIDLVYGWKWSDETLKDKVKKCDYIFSFTSKNDIPDYVWNGIKSDCKVMGLSTKNFGSCNGIVYKNRHSENYFSQTVEILPGYKKLNNQWKEQWGENYIDMLTMSLVDENHVRVFTDKNKFISQDCNHLTRAGAIWYAENMNWTKIFEQE